MFHQDGAMRACLKPHAYTDPGVFEAEQKALFAPRWHFAGLLTELRRPGSQITCEVAGTPVLVRRSGRGLVAFVNVCAHRQSVLVSAACSYAQTLRCPYHGWEYNDEGRLSRLPDGASFRGLPASTIALRRVQVQAVGQLVFVCLSLQAQPVFEELGTYAEEVREALGRHRVVRVWETVHDVNWKVIAENAVESYHVPCVHPTTFQEFRPPELHDHTLHPSFTRYLDLKPWQNDLMGVGVRVLGRLLLGPRTVRRFTQAHLFPNLLLYYNELISTILVLQPLSPFKTRQVAISLVPESLPWWLLSRPIQYLFALVFSRMGERVLREDMRLWPSVQRGLSASNEPAWLGSREERVAAFQCWVDKELSARAPEKACDVM